MTETIKDKIKLISGEFPTIRNIHSIYFSNVGISDVRIKKEETKISNKPFQLLHLYLDVQMDDKLDFKIAHGVVDEFEEQIKKEIKNIVRITTHIETDLDAESTVGQEEFADQVFLNRIKEMALSIKGVSECDDISLVYVKSELHITLTIKINPDSLTAESDIGKAELNSKSERDVKFSVEKAHSISTLVQNLLLQNTSASRVIVHAEPT